GSAPMSLLEKLGLSAGQTPRLTRQVKLQLLALGLVEANGQAEELADTQGLLQQFREQTRLLTDHRCPIDERIEAFLASYFRDLPLNGPLRLPDETIILHRHGLAREMSLP